jgi:hypothetical protein
MWFPNWLVCLHFEYTKRNGTGKVQTGQTLVEIANESKRKYDQDVKNKEDQIKEKKLKEEAEKKELSQQRAEALASQVATGKSLALMAEGMMAFMSPEPGGRGRQHLADAAEAKTEEEIRALKNRLTAMENLMSTGFADIKELLKK